MIMFFLISLGILILGVILSAKLASMINLQKSFRITFEALYTPVCIINSESKIIWKNKIFCEKFASNIVNIEEFEPKKILHNIQVTYDNDAWTLQHIQLQKNFAVIFQPIKAHTFNWWDSLPFPIGILNKNNYIVQGNENLKKLLGTNHGNIKDFANKFNLKDANSEIGQELVWKSKFGIIPIITWIKNYGDDKILILENRSEFIKLKNKAQEAQHLQVMGQLTCGIIHDFNNLLTAISGFSEMLETTLPDNDMLNEIKRNTIQAANLAKELLNFVKSKNSEQNLTDPVKFLLSRKIMLQKLLGEKIKIEISVNEKEGSLIDLSDTQMEQIILNMSLNGKDAMPNGGTIRIKLQKQTIVPSIKIRNHVLASGTYFIIEISDTGTGIDKENLAKVFAPFFSTKEKGTGLGLASCMRIINHVGGIIDFKTSHNGTSFYIYAPVSSHKTLNITNLNENEAKTSEHAFSKKTLVLVEDEEAIRNLMEKTLTQAGYIVHSYSDGLKALQDLKKMRADGLITDAIVPGIDGIGLTETVRKIKPNLPILIVSGYSLEDLTPNLPNNVHYLEKPFTLKILKDKVNLVFQAQDLVPSGNK